MNKTGFPNDRLSERKCTNVATPEKNRKGSRELPLNCSQRPTNPHGRCLSTQPYHFLSRFDCRHWPSESIKACALSKTNLSSSPQNGGFFSLFFFSGELNFKKASTQPKPELNTCTTKCEHTKPKTELNTTPRVRAHRSSKKKVNSL